MCVFVICHFLPSFLPNEYNFKVNPIIQKDFINARNFEGPPQRNQWRTNSLIILGVN